MDGQVSILFFQSHNRVSMSYKKSLIQARLKLRVKCAKKRRKPWKKSMSKMKLND